MAKLSWHPDENVRADDLKKYIAIFQKLLFSFSARWCAV